MTSTESLLEKKVSANILQSTKSHIRSKRAYVKNSVTNPFIISSGNALTCVVIVVYRRRKHTHTHTHTDSYRNKDRRSDIKSLVGLCLDLQ